MNPTFEGYPSIVQKGDLDISTEVADGQSTIVARQHIQLSDGRELTVTARYKEGTDQETILRKMDQAIVKMIDIAIIHELGNPERENPTSSLVLRNDDVLEKKYEDTDAASKKIADYSNYLSEKEQRYVERLGSEDLDQLPEVQKRLFAVRHLKGMFQDTEKTVSKESTVEDEKVAVSTPVKQSRRKQAKKILTDQIGPTFANTLRRAQRGVGAQADNLKMIGREFVLEITNPYDPEWRKNTKYQHILDQFADQIEDFIQEDQKVQLEQWIDDVSDSEIDKTPAPEGGAKETERHLKNALRCLHNEDLDFSTNRDRYLAFMKHYKLAMKSEHYRTAVKEGDGGLTNLELGQLEREDFSVALIHALALVEFKGVNTQGFTEGISRGIAKSGGFEEIWAGDEDDPQTALKEMVSFLDPASKGIQDADMDLKTHSRTQLASSLVGEHSAFDFDPLVTGGNPANVKAKMVTSEGRERVMVRTPSPTKGKEVTPMFKAYLRALKARNQRHVYINLQDRRRPNEKEWKAKYGGMVGFMREDRRVDALEALNDDDEFGDTIQVFSFDKNSDWYWQSMGKSEIVQAIDTLEELQHLQPSEVASMKKKLSSHGEWSDVAETVIKMYREQGLEVPRPFLQKKEDFIDALMFQLHTQEGAYSFPGDWLKRNENQLEQIAKLIGTHLYSENEELSPRERQDFLEIFYNFSFLYILANEDPDAFNASCKDCIDRGGGATWLIIASLVLLEAENCDDPDRKKQLVQSARSLVAKFNEDAVWARKRHAIDDRRHRARNAYSHLLNHPKQLQAFVGEMSDAKLFEGLSVMTTVDVDQMQDAMDLI